MADADAELVLQTQQGSPAAFEELVRNHQRMIHSLTFRMTGSLADAEDLAQETFLRAYEQIGSFRGGSKFSTWLYRIAVNTCLNWRQSEARRFQLHAQAAEEFSAQHANEANFSADQTNEVQAALLKLPAKQRAAIVLTIYDGLNHAEAAQVLGCSETTVSWRVFAAKRKLKRLLKAGRVAPHAPLPEQKRRAEDCAPHQTS
jgi:RNA polymerase sigma-70 factor (ECF subfamily)